MLFATPIVKEQVKLDLRFADAKTVTDEDLATIAMERRGLRDLELMRHVNSMLKEAGSNYMAMRLYNGSGERLWLGPNSYSNDSFVWKYPPDLFIDPGQWSVVIADATPPKGSILWGRLALAYRGAESGITAYWANTNMDSTVGLATDEKNIIGPRRLSIGNGRRVATIYRGYAGNNVIVDGIYTTSKQFPHLNPNV